MKSMRDHDVVPFDLGDRPSLYQIEKLLQRYFPGMKAYTAADVEALRDAARAQMAARAEARAMAGNIQRKAGEAGLV